MNLKRRNNFAFIDSQNLNLGIQAMGWSIDWKKFRIYLRERFNVQRAYLFLGYVPKYKDLYKDLRDAGFVLIFKPIVFDKSQKRIKGNCDAELVLQAMIDFHNYEQGLIVSGDGDFYCLVNYLKKKNKLDWVLAPNSKKCSSLLKISAGTKLLLMDNMEQKLSYTRNGKGPHEDGTS